MALQRKLRNLEVCVYTRTKGAAGLRSTLGSGGPIALSCFDLLPMGVNPPPERGERLVKGSTKVGEFVEVCRLHPPGIQMPPDQTVALSAPQRLGEHLR